MKTTMALLLVITATLSITSCKKSDQKDFDNPNPTGTTGPTGSTGSTGTTGSTGSTGVVKVVKTKVDPGVYLVGYKSMVNFPLDPRAVIWKDNNPTVLSTFPSYANAMCVQDTNIYVAGVESPSLFASNAVYWVNNQIVRLTFNSNIGKDNAVGIGVVGKDLYVAGNIGGTPVYWKNDDLVVILPTPGSEGAATDMVVKGKDVYICGKAISETPYPHVVACYWKNGVLYGTSDNTSESGATAITVTDNGDVYLSGYTMGTHTPRQGGSSRPAFWKNNAVTVLPFDKPVAMANGIAVDGGNIYVSGTANDGRVKGEDINTNGVLWTNGTPKNLGNSLLGGRVTAIQGEVYVAGLRPIGPLTDYGIVFKNGAIIAQGSLTSFNNILVIK
jgi:hypothetical protein